MIVSTYNFPQICNFKFYGWKNQYSSNEWVIYIYYILYIKLHGQYYLSAHMQEQILYASKVIDE